MLKPLSQPLKSRQEEPAALFLTHFATKLQYVANDYVAFGGEKEPGEEYLIGIFREMG